MASELRRVRNAPSGLRSQPVGDIGPLEASCQLTDAQILFQPNLIANVALRSSICFRCRLIQNPDEGLRCGGGVLDGSQSPGVEITRATSLHIRAILQTSCLILLQKLTEWTSRLVQNLEDRLVHNELSMSSHPSTSASREPPHTAMSPRSRLPTA
jgi:hypothetical protein